MKALKNSWLFLMLFIPFMFAWAAPATADMIGTLVVPQAVEALDLCGIAPSNDASLVLAKAETDTSPGSGALIAMATDNDGTPGESKACMATCNKSDNTVTIAFYSERQAAIPIT